MNEVKRLVWDDLKKVRARLDEPVAPPAADQPVQHTLFD